MFINKHFDNNKFAEKMILFSVTVLLHIIPVFIVRTPTSCPDEVITLGYAALLSGKDWSYLATYFGAWYGCGSSWMLAGIYWAFKDGMLCYDLARITIAIFLSIPAVICYDILTCHLKYKTGMEVWLVSICATFLTNASAELYNNEAMLNLCIWVIVLLLIKIEEGNKKTVLSTIVMFVCSYGIICHTRAIMFIVQIFLSMIIIYKMRKRLVVDVKGICIGSVFIFIAEFVIDLCKKQYYQNVGALEQIQNAIITGDSVEQLANNFFSTLLLSGIKKTLSGFLTIFFTNVYALLIYSVGIVAIAITCAIFMHLKVVRENNKILIITVFCLGGLIVNIIAMGVVHCWHGINLLDGELYGDGRFFFYLRYYINFLPPLIIPIYYCFKSKESIKIIRCSMIVVAILYVFFNLYFEKKLLMSNINEFDVGGLYRGSAFGVLDYSISAKLVLIYFMFFCWLLRHNEKRTGVCVIFAIWLFLLWGYQIYHCASVRKPIADNSITCVNAFRSIVKDDDVYELIKRKGCFLVGNGNMYGLPYYIQLLVPDVEIRPIAEDKPNEGYSFANSFDEDEDFCIMLDENEFIYAYTQEDYNELISVLK